MRPCTFTCFVYLFLNEHPNSPRVKRESVRGERKETMNRWSMRWLYLTSKSSGALQTDFGAGFAPFSGLCESRDVPQSALGAHPRCCRQKDPNNATFSRSGATCQWLFCLFSAFPPFSLPFWHSFLLASLFCVLYPWFPCKRSWDSFPPIPFVKRCVLGISMVTYNRGHVNGAFWLRGLGVFFLCPGSEWMWVFETQSRSS